MNRSMDWAKAIEINQRALSRIVAEIWALIGLVSGGSVERLPHRLYRAAERMLRPAESAVRRLIVIAARGIVVKPTISRPMPKGLIIAGKKSGRTSFRLFDTRKNFHFIKPTNPLYVIVQTYNVFPNPIFNPPPLRRAKETESGMRATQLCRRLAAISNALETLPHQALRLARWKAKRLSQPNPKFTSPLRPGRPPGHRDEPIIEIDYILTECQALARDALREDSS